MTLEKYLSRLQEDPDWCPGWEAIAEAFERRYGIKGSYIQHQEISDERSPLEGFGVYHAPEGFFHVVTRGLTSVHADVDAFRSSISGWGFEMTLKWPESHKDTLFQSMWLLDRMAQQIDTCKRSVRSMTWKELGTVTPLGLRYGNTFFGLLFADDTDVSPIQTMHGRVEFRQMINVTEEEVEELKHTPSLLAQLFFHMKQHNPKLLMEPERLAQYLLITRLRRT